jgi:transcriptional regulator with XRE-family HTH domain
LFSDSQRSAVKAFPFSVRKYFSQNIAASRLWRLPNLMTLNLERHIRRAGLTQARLADMIGITPGYLSNLVSGRRKPSLDLLQKLAAALGVHVTDLYVGAPGGMSEPAVKPLDAPMPSLQAACAAINVRADHPAMYTVTADAPGFAICAGDTLVVDLRAQPRTGDMVLANILDATGGATTELRRLYGDMLAPASPGAAVTDMKTEDAAVLARVVAVIRALPQT